MKTLTQFLVKKFILSFCYVTFVMLSLIVIINLISELDFFKDYEVNYYLPIYLALLNSSSIIFEILPFIMLISTQFFFIGFFNNNEIQIFKYSGLRNSKIILIVILTSFLIGLFSVIIFYNLSSKTKKIYLEMKSSYTLDGKYLAVITKNGLWIKDKVENQNLIINAKKFENNYLIDTFITILNEEFEKVKNIKSDKIDMIDKKWTIYNPEIYVNNNKIIQDQLNLVTNFDYNKIQNLFSNLSSLSFLKLLELKENYIQLNYSTTEVNAHIQKIISYPLYLMLMTLLSSILMFRVKHLKSYTFQLSIGFMIAVLIYYINNFFYVLCTTERISFIAGIWLPIIFLAIANIFMLIEINEK